MNTLAFISQFGGTEILIIFVVIMLLFGAKRLPDLARSMGRSINEFKKGAREIQDDLANATDPVKEEVTDSTKAS